jgi:Tol biopolymer transport system component
MMRNGNRDIYIWNLERQSLTRLTTSSAEDILPLWSPDSRRVFFSSNRQGTADIYSQAADGASEARVEFEGDGIQFPNSFTPDGARLVVYENPDLSVLNLAQPDRLEPLLRGESNGLGELSPDGNWIAYESNESGQPGKFEIFLRPFPNVGAQRVKISIGGGRYPRWSRQGTDELFYVNLDGGMMAASVRLSPSLKLGSVSKLFDGVRPPTFVSGNPYDVSPDGRFLVVAMVAVPGESTTMSVVVNWFEELRELVPQH